SSSYDTYPLYEIQAQTKQKQDLVQHIMVFENYPVEQEVEHGDISEKTKLKIANFRGEEHTNYDFNVLVMPGREMQVHLQYNANVYSRVGVEQIKDHLIHLMN
ncbi:condensation domain-containing protein, partial [Bacillus subtilis]